MKVAVAYEPNTPLVLEDLPEPEVGARDVRVRIAASGICHTDLNVIEGRSALALPIVPGHEACGTVEAVGDEVRRVKTGDRVLASVSPACGSCWWCTNGMSNHCERGPIVQQTKRFTLADGRQAGAVCGCGSFAEVMVVDEASVVAVQTDLADEQLALLREGDHAGRRARALGVRDDLRLAAFEDGDRGVRRAEVDADDLAHADPSRPKRALL